MSIVTSTKMFFWRAGGCSARWLGNDSRGFVSLPGEAPRGAPSPLLTSGFSAEEQATAWHPRAGFLLLLVLVFFFFLSEASQCYCMKSSKLQNSSEVQAIQRPCHAASGKRQRVQQRLLAPQQGSTGGRSPASAGLAPQRDGAFKQQSTHTWDG